MDMEGVEDMREEVVGEEVVVVVGGVQSSTRLSILPSSAFAAFVQTTTKLPSLRHLLLL